MPARAPTMPLDRWLERIRRVRAARNRRPAPDQTCLVPAVDLVIGDRVRWLGGEIEVNEMVVTPHEVLVAGTWNESEMVMPYLSIESVQVATPRPVS